MVRRCLALGIILAATATLTAQPPAGAPAAPPPAAAPPTPDPVLVRHLVAWEEVMKTAGTFYSECTRVVRKPLARVEITSKGDIRCMRPGLARTMLATQPGAGQPADMNNFELYVVTQRAVYQYEGAEKKATEYRFPAGGRPQNLLLDFMSGAITAQAALERFDIKVAKEDDHYVYLEILPRTGPDQQDFQSMMLVLFRNAPGLPAYLPAQAQITKPLGQTVEDWTFKAPRANVKGVTPVDFQPLKLPPEWKTEVKQAPPAAGPPGPNPGGRVPVQGANPAGVPPALPRP